MLFRKTDPTAPPKPPKSKTREWVDSLVFAIVAATLIRWATFEAYVIPSPSMEHSLLVGDYLFVSKLHYGPITPQTPLQIPLTHQTVPIFGFKSYSTAIQLPTYRLPGFSSVKRNDVVVFHVPFELQHPADLRTNYIKRCVAIAGDTIELKGGQLYVNGQPAQNPAGLQTRYFVQTSEANDQVQQAFREHGVVEYHTAPNGELYNDNDGRVTFQEQSAYGPGYTIDCTPEVAAYFKQQPWVKGVIPETLPPGHPDPMSRVLFPDNPDMPTTDQIFAPNTPGLRHWTPDNYGPLPIPKKGQTVQITPQNAAIYYKLIKRYEHNADADSIRLTASGNDLVILRSGKPLTSYTIQQNYYWMMGDNRHNSEDSRYWGFVPEDHIVGKASLIWLSLDPYAGFLRKVRWGRLFHTID